MRRVSHAHLVTERLYRHPNWAEAFRALRTVLPAATGFSPDDLPAQPPDRWKPLRLDDRTDSEIVTALWSTVPKPATGVLVVVPFTSFSEGLGPFFVQASDLDAFIDGHAEATGDVFFSGDVVIVDETGHAVIVIHHEEIVGYLTS